MAQVKLQESHRHDANLRKSSTAKHRHSPASLANQSEAKIGANKGANTSLSDTRSLRARKTGVQDADAQRVR